MKNGRWEGRDRKKEKYVGIALDNKGQ